MKTQYVKIEEINERLQEIGEAIIKGKNVVFPTETVYGIGANAFDEEACKKIFEIKGRPSQKPLIVLISDKNMLENIACHIGEIEKKLMEAFWPGPLTIILAKKAECKVPELVTAGKNEVSVRMTSGKIGKMLIEEAGVPIVAPSANLSGSPTGTKIQNIIHELGNKVDYMIDDGDFSNEVPSTLVKVQDDIIYVLRQGKISKQELEKIAEVKIV